MTAELSPRPPASINVDVDTLCILFRAYGLSPPACENATFSRVIPRMLEFFRARDVRATFFVVGEYARRPQNRGVIERMVSEGHELASHSYSHPPNFSALSSARKTEEIEQSIAAIETASGVRPTGFRAPGWDLDTESFALLEKNRFVYDSSILPSPFLAWMPAVMNALSPQKVGWQKMGSPDFARAPREPYFPNPARLWDRGHSPVLEIPVATFAPVLPMPFYATAFFVTSPAFFSPAFALLNNRKTYLNFQLHSVDFLDAKSDAPATPLGAVRQPAVHRPLAQKTAFFEKAVQKIGAEFEIMPLRDLARCFRQKLVSGAGPVK